MNTCRTYAAMRKGEAVAMGDSLAEVLAETADALGIANLNLYSRVTQRCQEYDRFLQISNAANIKHILDAVNTHLIGLFDDVKIFELRRKHERIHQ